MAYIGQHAVQATRSLGTQLATSQDREPLPLQAGADRCHSPHHPWYAHGGDLQSFRPCKRNSPLGPAHAYMHDPCKATGHLNWTNLSVRNPSPPDVQHMTRHHGMASWL